MTPKVSNVTFNGAPDRLGESGLLGWVSLTLDGLVRIEGIEMRRLLNGALALRYPRHWHASQCKSIAPVSKLVQHAIELQVITALSMEVRT